MFTMAKLEPPKPRHPARKLQKCLYWRNANARHPDVLTAQRHDEPLSAANANNAWAEPEPQAA